jgi:hypothetical protein
MYWVFYIFFQQIYVLSVLYIFSTNINTEYFMYFFSTNISTEYFIFFSTNISTQYFIYFFQQICVLNILNMLYTLRFPLQNAVYFIILHFWLASWMAHVSGPNGSIHSPVAFCCGMLSECSFDILVLLTNIWTLPCFQSVCILWFFLLHAFHETERITKVSA